MKANKGERINYFERIKEIKEYPDSLRLINIK